TSPTSPSRTSRRRVASWLTVRIRGAAPARSITGVRADRGAPRSPFPARDEGLEDLPALQELERMVELRVRPELALVHVRVDRLRRCPVVVLVFLALRLGALALGVLEVARQVRFAQERRVLRLVALGEDGALVEDDVRHDAGGLDGAAARRVVARGGEPQRRAVVE